MELYDQFYLISPSEMMFCCCCIVLNIYNRFHLEFAPIQVTLTFELLTRWIYLHVRSGSQYITFLCISYILLSFQHMNQHMNLNPSWSSPCKLSYDMSLWLQVCNFLFKSNPSIPEAQLFHSFKLMSKTKRLKERPN